MGPRPNERPSNFLDVIAHERGELLAGQQGARVPVQKHQQIEITSSSHGGPSEETRSLVRVGVRWIRGRNKRPPRETGAGESILYTTIGFPKLSNNSFCIRDFSGRQSGMAMRREQGR